MYHDKRLTVIANKTCIKTTLTQLIKKTERIFIGNNIKVTKNYKNPNKTDL